MGKALREKFLNLEVSDFGPIAEAKIELRPLTVFVGPSNTGKSYLAILIYALHRFLGPGSPNLGFGRRFLFPSSRLPSGWRDDLTLSDRELDILLSWARDNSSCKSGRQRQAWFGRSIGTEGQTKSLYSCRSVTSGSAIRGKSLTKRCGTPVSPGSLLQRGPARR